MDLSLYRICQLIGVPPTIWMIPNPLKIYEFLELTRFSGLQKNDEVLDLGCGKGHWTIALGKSCKYAIGVDTARERIKIANSFLRNTNLKNRVKFISSTLEGAQIIEGSLDHIFSFCVLEHIRNLSKVLVEANRTLKPGGKIHVSVDSLATISNLELLAKHKRENGVIQYFTTQSLEDQLQQAGFQVSTVYPILKGEFARKEFEKRIRQSYRYNLSKRIRMYRRFKEDDQKLKNNVGIMLVAHAVRPET